MTTETSAGTSTFTPSHLHTFTPSHLHSPVPKSTHSPVPKSTHGPVPKSIHSKRDKRGKCSGATCICTSTCNVQLQISVLHRASLSFCRFAKQDTVASAIPTLASFVIYSARVSWTLLLSHMNQSIGCAHKSHLDLFHLTCTFRTLYDVCTYLKV